MKEELQNQFIDKFKTELEKVKNPDYLIENEIKQINAYTTSKNADVSHNGIFRSYDNNTNSVFDLSHIGSKDKFIEIFTHYLIHENYEIDENALMYQSIKNHSELSISFAKYFIWLKELQGKLTSKKLKPKASLTHKQKMLILYYLGLDIIEHDKTSMSKLLYHLLDLNEDNTRKYLSYVANGKNEVRTKNNLKTVKTVFEKYGFLELSNTIQKDIDKIT